MKIGVIPIIRQDAIIFHSANPSEDDDSIVNMERPDIAPDPINRIIDNSNHQGVPRFLVGEMRNASTMFNLLVHKAVTIMSTLRLQTRETFLSVRSQN